MNNPDLRVDVSIIIDGQECPSYFQVGRTFLSDAYDFHFTPTQASGNSFD